MSKSFKIIPGVKLNIGKKSISTTIGKRGLSTNIGTKGTFINMGIPGTGIRYRTKLFKTKQKSIKHYRTHKDNVIEGAVILGFIIGGIIFFTFKSFLLSFIPIILMPILCVLIHHNNEL